MRDGPPPYDRLKPFPSRWVHRVPEHWDIRKLRTLIEPRNERNRPDLPLLSVAREKGVFVRTAKDANHNVIPTELRNYKVARTGNLVINKMKAWQGSLGIAPCDGIVSPAYYVYDFRVAHLAFGQALLRSRPYVSHFCQASDGVRVGQWDLSVEGMREIPVALPPPEEQGAIVRYVTDVNRRVDAWIRGKRRLIALLEEQKQAIIHRAVTLGVDPGVAVRPSGVDGLGDVPVHWPILRARFLFRAVTRRDRMPGDPKLSVTQKHGVIPTSEMAENSTQARSYASFQVCHADDLILNKYKAHLGVFWRAPTRGLITPNYTVFSPSYSPGPYDSRRLNGCST